jgi:hypothetical protein
MKKILVVTGILISLFGFFPLMRYVFDYNLLSAYGKGFIFGKSVLILVGISLVIIGVKKN